MAISDLQNQAQLFDDFQLLITEQNDLIAITGNHQNIITSLIAEMQKNPAFQGASAAEVAFIQAMPIAIQNASSDVGVPVNPYPKPTPPPPPPPQGQEAQPTNSPAVDLNLIT